MSQEGFGLVQALVVVGVIGAVSYFIMDALNINNRILQNVSSAKVIDDVMEDIFNRLKDPEMCAVDYYVSKEYDDNVEYAQYFNKRLYQEDLSLFPRETATHEIQGRFYGFGNFFMDDYSDKRIPFLLNRKGVERYVWQDIVRYSTYPHPTPPPSPTPTPTFRELKYDYSVQRLDYSGVNPDPAPAEDEVAYWALPEGLTVQELLALDFSLPANRKYLIGDKVAIKDIFFENAVVDGPTNVGSADLVVIFLKNINATMSNEGEFQTTLGGWLTRRSIKITFLPFSTPQGTTDTPDYYRLNRIRKCYADRNSYIHKVTQYYCQQNGGSFVDGECKGFDSDVLAEVREEICSDLYGSTYWNKTSKRCVLPRCKYGITGFDGNGVPQCLCNLVEGSGTELYRKKEGTIQHKNKLGKLVDGCP